MKVSLNTIRQYIDFELPPVDELVSAINQQLGQVEEVIDLHDKYKDVVVVKVLSTKKHEDADRLTVCVIDDGGIVKDVERDENGHVQVVCGAPNVREGMLAAWLPPRSVVPATYGTAEPSVLDAREIRGVKSNGMLAAADELAIGSDHAGIIEIDPKEWKPNDIKLAPGVYFAVAYGLDDTVLDIENKMFTHRPDCFGQVGIAREIAGILGRAFTDPDWYVRLPEFVDAKSTDITIFNNAEDKVPRFMAVALQGIVVKPSPLWLQAELVRLGSKPINNIVDATNYIMLLTAQPTHAYDYDKLRGKTLGVRMAKAKEKCTLLNGKSYVLSEDDIVIVDGDGVVGLGGVMGGGNSEVSDTTTSVVLEVASFDMYTIRKTSMRYGLFTDAVTRFNKGQSPLQNDRIIQRLMTYIFDVSPSANQASVVVDSRAKSLAARYKAQSLGDTLTISADFINERLGLSLSQAEIKALLGRVSFSFTSGAKGGLAITAPYWRTDIELPEDIVEEVGRLYGFDKLPRELPRRSIVPIEKNPVFDVKQRIRSVLRGAGANEVLTYSFVHAETLAKAGQDPTQAYRLGNALSPDLQCYRLSVTPSLLDRVHPNIKAGHDEFALFELGKAHVVGDFDDEGLPREYKRLALVWAAKKTTQAGFFVAKRYLATLTPDVRFIPLSDYDVTEYVVFEQLAKPFEPRRAAVIMDGDQFVGVVGEYNASTRMAFKLPEGAAGFEIFQTHLMKVKPRVYTPLSRFPKVTQDISLKVGADVSYESLFDVVNRAVEVNQPGRCTYALTPLSIYRAAGDKSGVTVTLRLDIASYERTLTDKDVSTVMDAVAMKAHQSLSAERA